VIRAGEVLATMRALPVRAPDQVLAPGPCLVLAPHPDDESLGCGGLIALAAAQRRQVHVAVLTDGTGSHAGSARYPAPRLAALRGAEVAEAVTRLGLPASALHFLRRPDRHAPHDGPAFGAAVDRVRGLLGACGAATLLTTWRGDPHGDHVAASLIARAAVRGTPIRLLEFPVWGWTLPDDTALAMAPPDGARVDVRAVLAAKRAAIAAHVSQTTGLIDDDPSGFRLTARFVDLFTGDYETFLHV